MVIGDGEDDGFVVRFTADEAIVLHDWIYNLESSEDAVVRINDGDALWAPLHRIGGTFDKALVAIFAPDYVERVESAKVRLKKRMGVLESSDASDESNPS